MNLQVIRYLFNQPNKTPQIQFKPRSTKPSLQVSTSEPDNSKTMEVDKPTVPAPDSSEDNHLEPEQSEPKSVSNGAECNGEVTESQGGDEDITSSNGSAHGKGKAKGEIC